MTSLENLIIECSDITTSKGFNLKAHRTQLVLIASELAEALQYVDPAKGIHVDYISHMIQLTMAYLEIIRKAVPVTDLSAISPDVRKYYLEEMVDVFIRWASYMGANSTGDDALFTLNEIMQSLQDKMEKNRQRPHLHGKAF